MQSVQMADDRGADVDSLRDVIMQLLHTKKVVKMFFLINYRIILNELSLKP